MTGTNEKLKDAVGTYLTDLARIRASGGATGELSNYGPLGKLLDAVGAALKPKVFCVGGLADQGAGHPDFGLYAAKQVQKDRPREGQTPERGVIEVKSPGDDAWLTAESPQVSRYWDRYRLVLATNLRDFVLVGEDAAGRPAKLETFRLAESEEDFWSRLEKPRAFADAAGAGLGEYLARALSHRAALAEPRDLAWLLASYARDGLARVEAAGDAPSLRAVRSALEEALGVRFEGEKGARFFHSTLVQTLFYGVFSAWVAVGAADAGARVWRGRPVRLAHRGLAPARAGPGGDIPAAFQRPAACNRSASSKCWTGPLPRSTGSTGRPSSPASPRARRCPISTSRSSKPSIRRCASSSASGTRRRKVVRYMVARVDKALKDDLNIPEGLAAENVYVLDPCCGTGAYLAEVLRRIAVNLEGQGLGALAGARVKQAATERVFGFEIMPAPFVVAHLQVGLAMQELDAPLADDETEPRRRIPDQRAHGLGAAHEQAAALPRA